jgi:hypothetical protein
MEIGGVCVLRVSRDSHNNLLSNAGKRVQMPGS